MYACMLLVKIKRDFDENIFFLHKILLKRYLNYMHDLFLSHRI